MDETIFKRRLYKDYDPETVDSIVPTYKGDDIYLYKYQRTKKYCDILVDSITYYDHLLRDYKSRRQSEVTKSIIRLLLKKKEICLVYLGKNLEMSGQHKALFDAIDKIF